MKEREVIVQILEKVLYDHAYASLSLKKLKVDGSIGFVTEVVYGTLRHYFLLQEQYKAFVKKVKKKIDVLFVMAIYQHHFMKVPDYAIVNTSVELVKSQEKSFVNAVLRKVFQADWIEPRGNEPKDLALRYSHPEWLIRLWLAQYGLEKTLEILEENQKPSKVYGRINPFLAKKEDFKDFTFYENECVSYEGNILSTKAFQSHQVLIQDRHSQLVVPELDLRSGLSVLDACASPGTKSQQIATYMDNEGEIISCDIYPHRLELINQLSQQTGTKIIHTLKQDAGCLRSDWLNHFDRILLDVPCSGLGDLSHKPEIRYHISPNSLDEIQQLQAKILEINVQYLKEDGILVYSTCTLNQKENHKQIQNFLDKHEEVQLVSEKTLFPKEGSDGFYYAKLRRKKKDMVKSKLCKQYMI
ncbi:MULTISPECIES: 16S rRNA (cytosine(967)-C(5))-methyltransferase RsmB [Terrabacteria group]|uniref:16S rRNA (cytosine(967)-C(5))-methyltransferase RsmB n=1 Tax=Bacillati TaxID=1783272 RepID=UPI001C6E45EB|nr:MULTISPECIES: 16S rRNA (cytosine(967)-C(5))-methyltransferase RsmB [Terrabacteria group]MBW9212365.1 16S rRNA (cytosine(967)-C(5))-methyltransferase RsmB [Trueperella sp. zg.1013]